jgi:hypothetical protein
MNGPDSNGFHASLAGAYPNHIGHRRDDDPSVAGLARARCKQDGLHDGVDHFVRGHNLNTHSLHKIRLASRVAIRLTPASDAPQLSNLGNGHASAARPKDTVFHSLELEWSDDGLDPFHELILS